MSKQCVCAHKTFLSKIPRNCRVPVFQHCKYTQNKRDKKIKLPISLKTGVIFDLYQTPSMYYYKKKRAQCPRNIHMKGLYITFQGLWLT
jgi:hypothetical protein